MPKLLVREQKHNIAAPHKHKRTSLIFARAIIAVVDLLAREMFVRSCAFDWVVLVGAAAFWGR